MESCPKCGFMRKPDDKECPQCGVIYKIYEYYIGKGRIGQRQNIVCPGCGITLRQDTDLCPICKASTDPYTPPPPSEESLERLKSYSYGQLLLHERGYLFEMIRSEQDVKHLIRYFLLYSLLFAAIYGLSLGAYAHNLQLLASPVKVPALLLGTLFICLPALYLLNVMAGSRLSLKQNLVLLLAATYLMSVILASMSPIFLVFTFFEELKRFTSILNLFIFSIAGCAGLRFFWKGIRYHRPSSFFALRIWLIIYILVGTQLAWILRPFLGERGHFLLFREIEGNFFLGVYHTLLTFWAS